ncbi:methylated-DNA--[protein]-cysteine S-methyltransferase [Spiroplasma culicicola]|uniref:methylated-DNA--[protein]-cysteine S-methyltransferase n=1 Tax=Spiroplasma culicicola AES-1 TaxID=1276246 RepID=W6A601_9MOLU|nr:methylated-DNA--[protein]-cysteine S-methyltransferase [Spiroplasma culicicola]AHI52553.1 hypothetical protein SCULI_v1c02120 [Spiroplasma culicicola AES-1]
MKTIYYQKLKINDFNLIVGVNEDKICYLGLNNDEIYSWFDQNKFELIEDETKIDKKHLDLIENYFNKKKLNLEINDFNHFGTKFRQQVWNEMLKLDYGEYITYQQLAQRINQPTAIRAVATAVAQNPILLLIPCHRIISKNGEVKFRSGKEIKIKLQKFESNN